MEKIFKVTKKTVLKNVEPETFETNEQWVNDNKRFSKFFIIEEIKPEVIQEIQEPEKVENPIVTRKRNTQPKVETVIEPEKQIENNEKTT